MMSEAVLSHNLRSGYSYLARVSPSQLSSALENLPKADLLSVDGQEVDVAALRKTLTQSQLTSLHGTRYLIINQADELSDVMQNTLLKLLEEPSRSLVVILQTEKPSKLLPTVLSRLHGFGPKAAHSPGAEPPAKFPETAEELHEYLGGMSREELVEQLTSELSHLQPKLLQNPNIQTAGRINLLNDVARRLEQNANQKLSVDYLVLHWFDA